MLMYIAEGVAFDVERVASALLLSPSFKQLRSDADALLIGEYECNDDIASICLNGNLAFISIDGQGDAALNAALDIQRGYNAPLHLIDDAYSFDIVLSNISSLSDLKRMISDLTG